MQLLNTEQITYHLSTLSGWQLTEAHAEIYKEFKFKNFYHTMAFVNAVAWLAHQVNHHPDLRVGYNYCHVFYSSHDAGGITVQDFKCAEEVEALFNTHTHF